MENFFERVGRIWPAGRRDLHWHILPSPSEASTLTEPFTDFPRPGLAGVPPRWLHCTLLHAVGLPADDVDMDRLTEEVARRARGIAPFSLTFDRPAIGAVAVEISGWPGAPFDELVDLATKATTAHAAAAFQPAASRYPHLSAAYTTTGADQITPADLRAHLAGIDWPLSTTVRVDRMHLVEQWHNGTHITWHPLASVPLQGAAA